MKFRPFPGLLTTAALLLLLAIRPGLALEAAAEPVADDKETSPSNADQALSNTDQLLVTLALQESARPQGDVRRARLSELAQAWAKRRASGVTVDPQLRQRFVDSCLVEDAPSIEAALAPCLRVLVTDDELADELNNNRSIQPRRLALLRYELRQGSTAQAETIIAALAAMGDSIAGAQVGQQLQSVLHGALQRQEWPAERLPELRGLVASLLDQLGSQHASDILFSSLLVRHAAAGALQPFTAWSASQRALLAEIPESRYSRLVHDLRQHRPSESAAAAAYQVELLELLAEPALASLVAPLPNLFARLLQAQLLSEADLLAKGERLASAMPRAGWAWHELARLRAGRADHNGARQAWQRAIAATTDDELRQRWTRELQRGGIEDAEGLEQLLSRLSSELSADFASDESVSATPAMFSPDLDLLRHRFAQDDVRLAQRRAAGELATLLRHELVGGELRDLDGLLRLITQQQVGDTVLDLLRQDDPAGRLIHARAYELLQPAERAVTLYQQLAADHPELPLIQRRLRAAALRAGDQSFVPELSNESDDELIAISDLVGQTSRVPGVGGHHRLLAQTRLWSAVLAVRPVATQRPAAWAETAVADFMRGASVSRPWRVYSDDIHASERQGVDGMRRVHQALFAALQPYPAWSEQAFARRVAATAGAEGSSDPSHWRQEALAALSSRARLSEAEAAAPEMRISHVLSESIMLPSPLSYVVRQSAADDPQLDGLTEALASSGESQHPEIQAQLAVYRRLLSARDQEFLAAADALLARAKGADWRVPAALDTILHFAAERCDPALIQEWISAQLVGGSLVDGQAMLAIERWALQLAEQPAAATAFFATVEAALPRQQHSAYARLLSTLSEHPALLPAIVQRLPELRGRDTLTGHFSMRIRNLTQRTPEEGMALLAGLNLLADADAAVPAMGRDTPLLVYTVQTLAKFSRQRQAGYRELLASQKGFLAGVWSELLAEGDARPER